MQEYLSVLQRISLFRGIEKGDLLSLLDCLGARKLFYPKGSVVFHAGEQARSVGAVLSGQVQIYREDADGNRAIMAQIPPGDIFAEAYACARTESLPISVWAAADSVVLLLNCAKIVSVCPSACSFHTQIVSNLLSVLAEKNIHLTGIINHLSRRTLREKLLSYLEEQATAADSGTFDIPFDRQELADYLCVDRSALSRELGNLRREGLLDVEKSRFTLRRF